MSDAQTLLALLSHARLHVSPCSRIGTARWPRALPPHPALDGTLPLASPAVHCRFAILFDLTALQCIDSSSERLRTPSPTQEK